MIAEPRHLAHFNWGTLKAPIGDPLVAPFVNAVGRVNDKAERSSGFVWRSGAEAEQGHAIGWPLFVDNPCVIASFSVWETPDDLRRFVYETVHGAFLKRSSEWFLPGKGFNYALWWVPAGHIPDMAEARARVEQLLAEGPSRDVFDFTYLAQTS